MQPLSECCGQATEGVVIRAGDWEPTPPRPGSLDDAMARGFDPDTARLPDSNEPLDAEWQGALDRSLEIVRALREEER